MTLSFDGGEIRIGKTLVSVGDYSVWERGAVYLISFRMVPQQKAVQMGVIYKVDPKENLMAPPRSRASTTKTRRRPEGSTPRRGAQTNRTVVIYARSTAVPLIRG
jgi:hypothetical protein